MVGRKSDYVGRLAPSPTGALHLGNARTFLVAWLRCRAAGGRMLLRVEDLDHPRVKPATVAQALADLRWLGLDWDEGPDVGGPHAPYIQSERIETYRAVLEDWRERGSIYPCACSRKDVEAARSAPHAGEDLPYPGTCRGRFPDEATARALTGRTPAWRFRTDERETVFLDGFRGREAARPGRTGGDFVVARGLDGPGYQLAVVLDDAAMGITEVVRADDLLFSTHRQLLLYEALGRTPPAFVHVPLVVGPDGRRLAKRHGDTRIAPLRERGIPAERVVGWLAWSCGWADFGETLAAREVLPRIDPTTIPPEPVVVTPRDAAFLGVED